MKKLNENHRAAIKYMLEGEMTMDQIAERVKKTRKTLYNWLKEPVFAAELEERKRQIESLYKARLSRNAGLALDRARDILSESEDDRAAAAVISDTLDRAGYPKLKLSDLKQTSKHENAGVIIMPEADIIDEEDGDLTE